MQQGKFKIALFGNIYQEKKSVAVQKFFAVASELKAELMIPASFYAFLTDNLQINVPTCRILDEGQGEPLRHHSQAEGRFALWHLAEAGERIHHLWMQEDVPRHHVALRSGSSPVRH